MDKGIIPFPEAVDTTSRDRGSAAEELMLRSFGFDSSGEMDEAMERYGDYCDSLPEDGKIPTFMEFMGRKNMASDSMNDISRLMEDRNFESEEELNRFLSSYMENKNDSPLKDFLGLSPSQMLELHSAPFRGESSLLTLGEPGIAREDVPLLDRLISLLELLDSRGVVASTAKGNLSLKIAQEAFEKLYFMGESEEPPKLRSEEDYSPLFLDRFILEETGCLTKRSRRFDVSPKGKNLIRSRGLSAFYRELFLFYVGEVNWSYDAYLPEVSFFQTNAVFFLHMINKRSKRGIGSTELLNLFIKAFPSWMDDITLESKWSYGEVYLNYAFINMICVRFLDGLGLAELSWKGDEREECHIKPTGLFSRFLKWK